ncbi:S-layer homology domain-containing protein [Paenibacillus herberti]|uniref:S-layer protein n=1 Tax=Paenibacillus herberti TaxID=1619309 RepID=A0A229P0W1_9BACL|nr:S-layer homology domain-containing protein [Paenibacillus herberti]OXM15770.1 S-layer protein [Paenibacillus herberti]
MLKNLSARKLLAGSLAALMLAAAAPQAAGAFSDVGQDSNAVSIRSLEQAGLISGTGSGEFQPKSAMTYSQAVSLLVKAFSLKLDAIQFIQKPEASHYFPSMSDTAWYSEPFLIAAINGLDLDNDVKPSAPISREQFAHLLLQSILTTGDYSFNDLGIVLTDEKQIAEPYRGSVQLLLTSNIGKLEESRQFKPKEAVSRSDAAAWVDGGIKFMDKIKQNGNPDKPSSSVTPLQGLSLDTADQDEHVRKVTVTAQAPNPGYGLRISGVRFSGDKAYISVEAIKPEPGRMYPQVITDVSAVTYIDASYTPVLESTGDEGSSQPFKGGILPGKNAR